MKKEQRWRNIIKYLIEEKNDCTAAVLSAFCHVSIRTIHNDLQDIKFIRLLHGAKLIKKPNAGIHLEYSKEQKNAMYREIQNYNFESSSNAIDNMDLYSILIIFMTQVEPIRLEDFANELYRSKSGIQLSLEEVEQCIQKYHCGILKKSNYGAILQGGEENIRQLFYKVIEQMPVNEIVTDQLDARLPDMLYLKMKRVFNKDMIRKVIDVVKSSEINMNIHYCDYDFGMLVSKCCILVKRNLLHRTIVGKIRIGGDLQEYYVATMMKLKLEDAFHIAMPESEIDYLEQMIISTRKQVNQIQISDFDEVLLDKFIRLVSQRLNVDLSKDPQLKINLSNHIKPAIRRMKYGISSENPLLVAIKTKYTEVYVAIMTTIDKIEEKEQIYFDANELGFICLHIVGSLNRASHIRSLKCLLICDEGLTFEIYLKNMIEAAFSELQIVNTICYDDYSSKDLSNYNLILNSTRYRLHASNIINIDHLFTEVSSAQVRHWIFAKEIENTLALKDISDSFLCFFQDSCKTRNDLIHKYCDYLVYENYVTTEFEGSVYERIQYSSTAIGRGVAVPHGTKREVHKSVILIIKLDTSIIWDDQLVDLVFFVAIGEDIDSDYSKIFRSIMHIASSDEQTYVLKNCQSLEEIKKLLFDK